MRPWKINHIVKTNSINLFRAFLNCLPSKRGNLFLRKFIVSNTKLETNIFNILGAFAQKSLTKNNSALYFFCALFSSRIFNFLNRIFPIFLWIDLNSSKLSGNKTKSCLMCIQNFAWKVWKSSLKSCFISICKSTNKSLSLNFF